MFMLYLHTHTRRSFCFTCISIKPFVPPSISNNWTYQNHINQNNFLYMFESQSNFMSIQYQTFPLFKQNKSKVIIKLG